MNAVKTAIPKGTRDILPEQFAKRQYIFFTIEETFKKYGYKPIETPAMELLSTLTGKYGDEGDKLMFKVLNSGNFLSSVDEKAYLDKNTSLLTPQISEKALRYDLTVPFARFVVQHFNELSFPFKRYQIQPVWRADRPQKGRYREFVQCDIDIIGSNSLLNEAELIKMTDDIFKKLNIDIVVKINNRKILSGIAEVLNAEDKIIDITVALDKLDKIGWANVKKELIEKDIPLASVEKLEHLVKMASVEGNMLNVLEKFLEKSEIGLLGIKETKEILSLAKAFNINCLLEFDMTLARGLNYYTGAILEVKALHVEMGSISGGGRYDDLTGIFGLKDMSGVGISYGLDRIYDVMEMSNLFPDTIKAFTKILFINFGDEEVKYVLPLVTSLRENNIATELYTDNVKIKKQMAYADKNKIAFVVIAGESEMSQKQITIKNMITGEQIVMPYADAQNYFVLQSQF